jgi:uroporphyrinogen decarboxylase
MTPRQRTRNALTNQTPDRTPVDLGGTILSSATAEMQQSLVDILGLGHQPRDERFRNFDNRIQEHFGCDMRSIKPRKGRSWGFRDVHEAPMRELPIDEIEPYPWPQPDDAMIEGLEQEARFLHEETDYFICAGQVGQGLFEAGCWLRGYDKILYDCALDPDWVHAFNRKLLAVNEALGDAYYPVVGPYVDMVIIGDDIATQNDVYISPDMWRDLYKPYFARYIQSIKRHCPNALIAHHSCGSTHKVLDDLAEIGVDVINPVQTRAAGMEPENLAGWKPRLAFHGGVDLQHVLPHGTAHEVEQFVKHLIDTLGAGGGYVLAACHTLPDDVKPANVIAMLEAARKHGQPAGPTDS